MGHYRELSESIRGGWYKPKPVRRVEIPKPDGGKRQLGVPMVIDRMVQQAVVQILQPIFEQTFSDNSFGFRPKRSAQQAVQRTKKYYEEGYTHVVDLDLEPYPVGSRPGKSLAMGEHPERLLADSRKLVSRHHAQ